MDFFPRAAGAGLVYHFTFVYIYVNLCFLLYFFNVYELNNFSVTKQIKTCKKS